MSNNAQFAQTETSKAANYFNTELVKFVMQYPVIYAYGKSETGWLRKGRRKVLQKLWTEFANKMDKPIDFCKKRWRALRDRYRRQQGKINCPPTLLEYLDRMSFLDSYVETEVVSGPVIRKGNSRNKRAETTSSLLKSTIVTQDMIEEILKQKMFEETLQHKRDDIHKTTHLEAFDIEPDPTSHISVRLVDTIPSDNKNKIDTSYLISKGLIVSSEPGSSELNIAADCEDTNNIGRFDLEFVNQENMSGGSLMSMMPYCSDTNIRLTEILRTENKTYVPINKIENEDIICINDNTAKPFMVSKSTSRPDDVIGNQKIQTINFFEDLGDYVSNHLSDEKKKQIRLMLWEVILAEELEMMQEKRLEDK